MKSEFTSRQVIGARFQAVHDFIEFNLPERASVTLSILDEDGRMYENLMEEVEFGPGDHEIKFEHSRFAQGTFYYRLTARTAKGEVIDTKKIIVSSASG